MLHTARECVQKGERALGAAAAGIAVKAAKRVVSCTDERTTTQKSRFTCRIGDTRMTCQIDHMIPKKSRVAMKQNEQGKGVDFHRTKTVFMSFELGQGRGGVLASLASTAGSRRRGNGGA